METTTTVFMLLELDLRDSKQLMTSFGRRNRLFYEIHTREMANLYKLSTTRYFSIP